MHTTKFSSKRKLIILTSNLILDTLAYPDIAYCASFQLLKLF